MIRIRLTLAALSLVLLCARAEPVRSQALARIGVITPAPASAQLEAALREGLRQYGYSEGKNISFEWRRSSGTSDDLHTLAVALTGAKVDVIVAVGTPEARAALRNGEHSCGVHVRRSVRCRFSPESGETRRERDRDIAFLS